MRSRFAKPILVFSVLSWANLAIASDAFVARVMRPDGAVEAIGGDPGKTPLGSLYKLYLYSYLTEEALPETPYTCTGQDPEEIFCCAPRETIGRELAIARSCSPYFSAKRLGVESSSWRTFWSKKVRGVPEWLRELDRLKPGTRVPVEEVLSTLLAVRKNLKHFDAIEKGVMGSVSHGTAKGALAVWGSSLRVKTYTWREDDHPANAGESSLPRVDGLGFTGGFGGWLPDGSAIWVSTVGHGRDSFLSPLSDLVAKHQTPVVSECVEVHFFDRYPVSGIEVDGRALDPAFEGPLAGRIRVKFKNGNSLEFHSDGSLRVDRSGGRISITGKFTMNEYLARVLEREASSRPLEAARAFTVVARTFLLQNSKRGPGCRKIADSSHAQRVSPAPASPGARAIADWSDGLVLNGVDRIRYHSTKSSAHRMGWTDAVRLAKDGDAKDGLGMREILASFYPEGRIEFGMPVEYRCEPDAPTLAWISSQSKRWRPRLDQEQGFEAPSGLKVCRAPEALPLGPVFARIEADEIYVPRSHTRNDEVSIVHEYLHLAFRNHPRGRDEKFIEKMAQALQEDK